MILRAGLKHGLRRGLTTTTKTAEKQVATKNAKAAMKKTTTESSTLKPTPAPTPASSGTATATERTSGVRIFMEGAASIAVMYGIFWSAETQPLMPVTFSYLHMQSMCAGGAGIGIALRAKSCNPMRRLAVGALSVSYAIYGSATRRQRNTTHRDQNQRATASTAEGVAKDISLAVVTMLPFFSSALSRSTKRFSSRNLAGVMLSSTCLLGAAVCQFKPDELQPFWSYLDNKSRHPGLFLEWIHWYGYMMLGGGAIALLAGPVAMCGHICYEILPAREIDAESAASNTEADSDSYRHRQRTVSAFWPIKYSNRYISDYHLYESVLQHESILSSSKADLEQRVVGEWVVDIDLRPKYDQLLGRSPLKLGSVLLSFVRSWLQEQEHEQEREEAQETSKACAVLIRPNKQNGLEMRYSDGRTYNLLPSQTKEIGKYTVVPLPVTSAESEQFWTHYPAQFFNWVAADMFRMDPNEVWLLEVGSEGNEAYVVLSDGDMRSRYQGLRRPRNKSGRLHPEVHARLVKQGTNQGFLN